MGPIALRERLRAALDPSPEPHPEPGERIAAVLALLIESPPPSLLFTVRSHGLSRHAGEISFPGGVQEPGESLAEAAMREAFEEIGLDPEVPDLLGALPPIHTHVSGFLVVPFVAAVPVRPRLVPSDIETAAVLTFSLEDLSGAERQKEYQVEGGRVWRGWAYELDGHTVWGATGWMLHALLEIVRKEPSWMTGAR